MIKDVMDDTDIRMGKAIDALRRDLATIRTGRASPSLVERLQVDYGSSIPAQSARWHLGSRTQNARDSAMGPGLYVRD